MIPGRMIREPIKAEVQHERPEWDEEQSICLKCVNRFRAIHLGRLLEMEKGELTALDQEVVRNIREQETIVQNTNIEFEKHLTFGERISDHLSQFGGSWKFIIIFAFFLLTWISVNSLIVFGRVYDPYPFILLNLILSCLAAIQAPIILMSQNRLEAKDRLRGEHDYQVDLKAELEIRLLHAKLDQLLTHQWQRLLEIQQMQMDLMEDLMERGVKLRPRSSEERT
jgi:uncharacterized membrane protein